VLYQHLGARTRSVMWGCDKKTRMKVCRDRNQTEDLTLHIERVEGVMDLLVDGPGLVLCSVLEIQPTHDDFQLALLV
jgi:hypothetical protein